MSSAQPSDVSDACGERPIWSGLALSRKVFLQIKAASVLEWFMGEEKNDYVGLGQALCSFIADRSAAFSVDLEKVYLRLEPICNARCGNSCHYEPNRHFFMELLGGMRNISDEDAQRTHTITEGCRLTREELNYFLPHWFPLPRP
jgi:hypothetical protein